MNHDTVALLESALAQAKLRQDLREQGKLARELGRLHLQEASQQAFLSAERGSLLAHAERHLQMSASCFLQLADIVQGHYSLGLMGAAEYDGGDFHVGINRMRRSIAVVQHQQDDVVELNLIIQFMLRARPASWIYLRRAFQLTRKYSPQAGRRWEVTSAAIGNDIYDWREKRRQRTHAA